jgi:quercetin dioxygenase-like cupin family protein
MTASATEVPAVRAFHETPGGDYRWDGVDVLAYKPTGTHFRDITRQVLFDGEAAPGVELRYFEVAPGGHSTFERHEHVHAVLVLRGRGRVLVGEAVSELAAYDLVRVPPMTWHQFHAAHDAPLGFLCLVACERDRPQRPSEDEVATLRAHPVVGAFMRT